MGGGGEGIPLHRVIYEPRYLQLVVPTLILTFKVLSFKPADEKRQKRDMITHSSFYGPFLEQNISLQLARTPLHGLT